MENRTINIAVVAEVAKALKYIKKDMVFVGGAVVSLYTDDPAADEIKPLLVSAKLRPTKPQIKNLSWVSNVPFNAVVFGGLDFFWVTSKEVPRVDSRKSPVEVKKSKPSKIYLAL